MAFFNKQTDTVTVAIPFYGFEEYSGFIGMEINSCIEQEYDYFAEEYKIDFNLLEWPDIHEGIDYKAIARAYADSFPSWLESQTDYCPESMTFSEYREPKNHKFGKGTANAWDKRRYSYWGPEILVTVSKEDILALWEKIDMNEFNRWINTEITKGRLISYYWDKIEDAELLFQFMESGFFAKNEFDDPEYHFLDYCHGCDDIMDAINWIDPGVFQEKQKTIERINREGFDPFKEFFGVEPAPAAA